MQRILHIYTVLCSAELRDSMSFHIYHTSSNLMRWKNEKKSRREEITSARKVFEGRMPLVSLIVGRVWVGKEFFHPWPRPHWDYIYLWISYLISGKSNVIFSPIIFLLEKTSLFVIAISLWIPMSITFQRKEPLCFAWKVSGRFW